MYPTDPPLLSGPWVVTSHRGRIINYSRNDVPTTNFFSFFFFYHISYFFFLSTFNRLTHVGLLVKQYRTSDIFISSNDLVDTVTG